MSFKLPIDHNEEIHQSLMSNEEQDQFNSDLLIYEITKNYSQNSIINNSILQPSFTNILPDLHDITHVQQTQSINHIEYQTNSQNHHHFQFLLENHEIVLKISVTFYNHHDLSQIRNIAFKAIEFGQNNDISYILLPYQLFEDKEYLYLNYRKSTFNIQNGTKAILSIIETLHSLLEDHSQISAYLTKIDDQNFFNNSFIFLPSHVIKHRDTQLLNYQICRLLVFFEQNLSQIPLVEQMPKIFTSCFSCSVLYEIYGKNNAIGLNELMELLNEDQKNIQNTLKNIQLHYLEDCVQIQYDLEELETIQIPIYNQSNVPYKFQYISTFENDPQKLIAKIITRDKSNIIQAINQSDQTSCSIKHIQITNEQIYFDALWEIIVYHILQKGNKSVSEIEYELMPNQYNELSPLKINHYYILKESHQIELIIVYEQTICCLRNFVEQKNQINESMLQKQINGLVKIFRDSGLQYYGLSIDNIMIDMNNQFKFVSLSKTWTLDEKHKIILCNQINTQKIKDSFNQDSFNDQSYQNEKNNYFIVDILDNQGAIISQFFKLLKNIQSVNNETQSKQLFTSKLNLLYLCLFSNGFQKEFEESFKNLFSSNHGLDGDQVESLIACLYIIQIIQALNQMNLTKGYRKFKKCLRLYSHIYEKYSGWEIEKKQIEIHFLLKLGHFAVAERLHSISGIQLTHCDGNYSSQYVMTLYSSASLLEKENPKQAINKLLEVLTIQESIFGSYNDLSRIMRKEQDFKSYALTLLTIDIYLKLANCYFELKNLTELYKYTKLGFNLVKNLLIIQKDENSYSALLNLQNQMEQEKVQSWLNQMEFNIIHPYLSQFYLLFSIYFKLTGNYLIQLVCLQKAENGLKIKWNYSDSQIQDLSIQINLYISECWADLNQNHHSFTYLQKALQFSKDVQKKKEVNLIIFKLFMKLQKYELALKIIKEQDHKIIENQLCKAICLLKLNRLIESKKGFNKLEKKLKESSNEFQLGIIYYYLSLIFWKQKLTYQASMNCQKAIFLLGKTLKENDIAMQQLRYIEKNKILYLL